MAEEIDPSGREQTGGGMDDRWSRLTAILEQELRESRSPADSLRDVVVSVDSDSAESAKTRSAEASQLVGEMIAAGQEAEIGELAYSLSMQALNTGRDSVQQADSSRLSALTASLRGESHARYAAGYEQARQAYLAELRSR